MNKVKENRIFSNDFYAEFTCFGSFENSQENEQEYRSLHMFEFVHINDRFDEKVEKS